MLKITLIVLFSLIAGVWAWVAIVVMRYYELKGSRNVGLIGIAALVIMFLSVASAVFWIRNFNNL